MLQILSITWFIPLSYDVVPDDGKWTFLNSLQRAMSTTVLLPVDAIRVRFQSRRDVNDGVLSSKA